MERQPQSGRDSCARDRAGFPNCEDTLAAERPRPSKQAANVNSGPALDQSAVRAVSERELVSAKRPSGHLETVAVIAFALTQAGIEEFTEDDVRRAYLRAEVRPPKVVAQALRDAKNRMDYIEAGSKRGCYRLSPHGDRTVRFDLPRP